MNYIEIFIEVGEYARCRLEKLPNFPATMQLNLISKTATDRRTSTLHLYIFEVI